MSLRVKLTLALLITSLSGVLIVAVLVQRVTINEFDSYVLEQERANFIADMVAYYEVFGSWDDMRMARGRLPFRPDADPQSMPPPEEPPFNTMRANKFTLVDQNGKVITPSQDYGPDEVIPASELKQADRIVVEGETVGYVLTNNEFPERDALEEAYLDRINRMLILATVSMIGLGLLLSLFFARSLSRPLREIAQAIRSLSHGKLDQKVPVRSRDEVGEVAAAFNQMSADLVKANQLRRQMTADIAHELRTPLSVLVGYLESLCEGLLKPNPARFKIMHDEARHLQHLVEDLRTLSLADAGELQLNAQWIAAEELIRLTAAAFSHQAEQQGIRLAVEAEPNLPLLHADPDRIIQVLSNLVSNALRYTPQEGCITLAARLDGDVVLSVQDTGAGIEADHLPHIFERFYRADMSRQQSENESGLGLAIAKSYVELHGGTISADSQVGVGTTISIRLPVSRLEKDAA